MPDIDEQVDALGDAVAAAGGAPLQPARAEELDALDQIDHAVGSYVLPPEMRRLWERVDPYGLSVQVYPALTVPSFALDTWVSHRDEFPDQAPQALFPVAYESWALMSIELEGPWGPGGALFEWRLDDPDFHARYESVAEWLGRWVELVSSHVSERSARPDGSPLLPVDDPETERPLAELGRELKTHPLFAGITEIVGGPAGWPEHWRLSSGLATEDLRAYGATHSIAEVLASNPSQPFRATVQGMVKGLGVGPKAGTRWWMTAPPPSAFTARRTAPCWARSSAPPSSSRSGFQPASACPPTRRLPPRRRWKR